MLGHLAARVLDAPLLLHPAKARTLLRVLADRGKLGPLVIEGEQMAFDAGAARDRSPLKVEHGVALLDVHGTLVHRARGLDALSGLTSYEQLSAEFAEAMGRSDVDRIELHIDSPGGEVAGAFDLADQIRAARGVKPVVAFAHDMACSAAYLIGCAAEQFYATQTAWLGSIGVITAHVDQSKAEADAGYHVTVITSGEAKAYGNPHAPLTGEARETIQADVDRLARMFFDKVAESRPGLTAAGVEAWRGATFIGQQAIDLGLADQITSASNLYAAVAERERRGFLLKGARMSDQESGVDNAEQEAPEVLTAEAVNEQHPEVAAALRAEGIAQERERVAALEAKGAEFPALLAKAKAEGWTLERFAVASLDEKRAPEASYLAASRQDSPEVEGADPVVSAEAPSTEPVTLEERIRSEWASGGDKLQAEFGRNFDTFMACRQAEERGLVKVAGKRG